MDRGAWRASVHEVARVGHDLATIQEEEKEGKHMSEVRGRERTGEKNLGRSFFPSFIHVTYIH